MIPNPIKLLIGYIAYKKDPIGAGSKFIKQTLKSTTDVNPATIPDPAYRLLAQQCYKVAEFVAKSRTELLNEYMTGLEITVLQIARIMHGEDDDADDIIRQILITNGVTVPRK